MLKHAGIPFDFGAGQVFVIPPLTLGSFMRVGPAAMTALVEPQKDVSTALTLFIEIAHEALVRNYPDLSREAVGNMVDLNNIHDVLACALDIGGVHRKQLIAELALAQSDGVQTPALNPTTGVEMEPRHGQQ